MKEQDLVDLKFEKQQETAESSGCDKDWHYYTLKIGGICFISNENNDADEWCIEIFDFDTMAIKEKADAEDLINLVRKNTSF